MIGNLLTKGPDKKTHRYPPNRRPQAPRPHTRYPNTPNNRPPRRIKYPLQLPIVQDTKGHPYPPQPNGATFSFQTKPQNPQQNPVTLSRAYDRGFLPSAPYWKTYDHLYKPNLTLTPTTSTTTQTPSINEFVEFIKPPTRLIAPGVNQQQQLLESTTNEPFLRLEEQTSIPSSSLGSTTATNFNPLNFNSQLNVASILSHLDDEDIEAIQDELSGVLGDNRAQLPPNLQEWYNTLENKNRSQSISLKRQVQPNQFQRGYFKPNQFQVLVKQQPNANNK